MSEQGGDDSIEDIPIAGSIDVQQNAIRSNYKVLGEQDADNGVGVLGQNNASSGTPIGVQGAVPNNTNGGYGLATPHDARVGGTAELSGLGGSITGGSTVTTLAGPGLSVSSNALGLPTSGTVGNILKWDGTTWTLTADQDTRTDASDDGTTVVTDTKDINFASNLSVTDDGDGTVTVDASGSKWVDSDADDLLEPINKTGIEVPSVNVNSLADNGAGQVAMGDVLDLNSNDLVDSGTTIWDASNGYVPNSRLQYDSVTVAGNAVALGGSTGIDHADLTGVGSADHHSRPAAGDGLRESLGEFNIEPSDFAGTALEDDGSNNLAVGPGAIGTSQLNTPFSTLSDLFGFTITAGSTIETVHPIESPSGNVLELVAGGRALGLVEGNADIPNEGRSISAPNVVAGHPNNSTGDTAPRGATVGGGGEDGGFPNQASANHATVGGGLDNTASGVTSTVGGGQHNSANADDATVGGGWDNTASGREATVGGGIGNTASDNRATVPGGGHGAAESSESFVWNDDSRYHSIPNADTDGLSSDTAINSEPATGPNTFSVSAQGGVRFITGSSSVTYIDGGSTGWSTTSTRAAKTNIDPVDPQQVLHGVQQLEVATWEYKDDDDNGEGEGTTHIGPMAEEFHDIVDVGSSDEHINGINADGVLFAAVQGLLETLDEKAYRVDDLKAENDRLQKDLEEKDDRITALEAESDSLREENKQLRDRLAAVEDHLGLSGNGEPAPADD